MKNHVSPPEWGDGRGADQPFGMIQPKASAKNAEIYFSPFRGVGGLARAAWRQKTKFLKCMIMNEKEKIIDLLKALYKRSPIAAIVIVCIEFGVMIAIFLLLSACTSNLFVQKGNSSSSISSQTSPSVTTKVDSTKVIVPINQKQK